MAKQKIGRLSAGELDLLEMLWREGPVTLSQAHTALDLPIGYTTVQTRLNRLEKKKVVRRTKTRPAKYEAAVTREQINQHDLDLLVNQVNQGAFIPLVAHLVRDRKLSRDDLDQLKSLIADAERANRSRNKGKAN